MKNYFYPIFLLLLLNPYLGNSQNYKQLTKSERLAFFQKNDRYTALRHEKGVQNNSKTIKQVLDSIISGAYTTNTIPFEPENKHHFQYDVNERINLFEVFRKSQVSDPWQYGGDNFGLPKKVFINNGDYDFTYITYDEGLNLNYKYEYFHNINNHQLTLIKLYYWDSDLNDWFFAADAQIFYQGNIEDYILYREYDDLLEEFVNVAKYDKTYAGTKQVNTIVSEWISNTWNNAQKYEFTYNTSNKVTILKYFQWISSSWSLANQQTFTYDSNSRLTIHSITQDPNVGEFHYTYDSQGNIKTIRTYFPSDQTTSSEIQFYYDLGVSANELVIPANQEVDGLEFTFLPFYIDMPQDEIYRDLHTYAPTNKLDSAVTFDYWSNPVAEGRYYYYYSERDLGLKSSENLKLNIFPNPFREIIHIENASDFVFYSLNDLHGGQVASGNITSSEIDLSQVNRGMYFLNLYTKDQDVFRTKVLKE